MLPRDMAFSAYRAVLHSGWWSSTIHSVNQTHGWISGVTQRGWILIMYRSILWTLECFPANVAEELDRPLQDLDTLLDRLDLELGLNNRKLESRMESIRRSRLLVDRLNEAVSILKTKPVNGHKMYDIIYMTFLGPDKLTHEELLYRLDISSRHYYRLRTQAINIIALRLWSAPAGEIDSWLEVLTILENW